MVQVFLEKGNKASHDKEQEEEQEKKLLTSRSVISLIFTHCWAFEAGGVRRQEDQQVSVVLKSLFI